jgi:uncharacterized protein YqhQ
MTAAERALLVALAKYVLQLVATRRPSDGEGDELEGAIEEVESEEADATR